MELLSATKLCNAMDSSDTKVTSHDVTPRKNKQFPFQQFSRRRSGQTPLSFLSLHLQKLLRHPVFKKFVFLLKAIPLTTDWLYDYNNHTPHRPPERHITNNTTRTYATKIICGYQFCLLVVWTKFGHRQGYRAIKKALLRLYIKFLVT